MESRQLKPFPWMCSDCRKKTVVIVRTDYALSAEHDGASYDILLSNVDVPTCARCGLAIITDDLTVQISTSLRRAAGLLSPESIQTKRESLGMTPPALASALGIPDATLVRWECGKQLQSKAMDLLLRSYLDSEASRRVCVINSLPIDEIRTAN